MKKIEIRVMLDTVHTHTSILNNIKKRGEQ